MKIILLGAPGSGKGTQAAVLSEYFGLKKFSVGDIFRQEVKKGSPLGREAKSFMDKGVLVPDEVVLRAIEICFNEDSFILDGYPRNFNQAVALQQAMEKKGTDIDMCVYLDVDEDTVIRRLSLRRVCRNCGAIYHLENMPPKEENICDICKNGLYQRNDDTMEVIKKRQEVFIRENNKILDFYSNLNKLLVFDAKGDKDIVAEKIKKSLFQFSEK